MPLLSLSNIDKRFFGVAVLKQVSLDVEAGSILGLIGENGAGKSTLMNILGGVLPADGGNMSLDGEAYLPKSARDADKAGIAFIHQELNLFANLTIAENLFLTQFPRRFRTIIDRKCMRRRASELLDRVGLTLSPNLKVENLSTGERQLVEIAKALARKARVLILDEPTSSLSERETRGLFQLLMQLRTEGMALIYISHALGDVRQLCDQVVVLRDGVVVAQGAMEAWDVSQLVKMMVGRDPSQLFSRPPPAASKASEAEREVALEASELTQPGVIEKVSFRLHRGEVLGIAGMMGSGRTELARIVFGLDPLERGRLFLNCVAIQRLSTRRRIALGLAMLTESRRDDGLCMAASTAENMRMVVARKFVDWPWKWLRSKALLAEVSRMSQSVKLASKGDLNSAVRTLSGGNQQKVVLAKWLLNKPSVLILDEPTRGIDVGAKFEIYSLIHQLAAGGDAVLVISSELEELLGICDRILVMSRGEVTDDLARAEFDRHRIMRSALQADWEA